ncbi:cupin domain-containing protein [Alkalibacterium sp. 20]|uniref:cupin domain-containing protein n=1 Tax=Alkalibacterium sp. 20 TaxID=1798803 RepID=UPI0008FFEA0D|nr:cupin domain-containing protein [Alkalibacterium sp. 20]OJF97151.1 cupin [Alkalibacterium sp. 20]
MKSVEQWIKELQLEPHPEGGYFKQTDLSDDTYAKEGKHLPLYTNIYFLLTAANPSHFHRLTSDELWFYHAGHPLTIHSLTPEGSYQETTLSLETSEEHQLHHTVPAGTIFGSTVEDGYALVSCTVVPGFDFADFQLFTKNELSEIYPEHQTIINKLAYDILPE